MSETHDKRRRTDLDAFVLALIESGISTPYELQKAAGLSPGATIPALSRLLEASFIRQGKPGVRGRTDHKTTATGRKFLKTAWRTLIEGSPSGDLDADLRVALLALWVGGDRQIASEFLHQSSVLKHEAIDSLKKIEKPDPTVPLADWYRKLRSSALIAQLSRESEAVLAMAESLPRSLVANPSRISSAPKLRK